MQEIKEFLPEIDIQKYLEDFSCIKDKDIEFFLKEKSLLFDKKSKARTYLVFNEEELEKGIFNILGYFTLSTKILHLPEELSKSQRKKIDGLYNSISEISTFLIGQLSKNDINNSSIDGKEILNYALKYIVDTKSIIGGRIVLIEVKNNDKLLKFYNNNDFILLKNKTENEEKLLQMIRVI